MGTPDSEDAMEVEARGVPAAVAGDKRQKPLY